MSLREIIKVPNPFLKVTAKTVTVIDEDILTILDDMMETMYHANGIGLAATQIAPVSYTHLTLPTKRIV